MLMTHLFTPVLMVISIGFVKIKFEADFEDDLLSAAKWCKNWLLNFNASKTKLLSINHPKEPFRLQSAWIILTSE